MSTKIKWDLGANATRDLVKALGPIRSHTETGALMGISRSAVFYIEKSALRKIQTGLRKACAVQPATDH